MSQRDPSAFGRIVKLHRAAHEEAIAKSRARPGVPFVLIRAEHDEGSSFHVYTEALRHRIGGRVIATYTDGLRRDMLGGPAHCAGIFGPESSAGRADA